VAELNYPNFFTLVVDNGSTDNSVTQIKAAHPHIEILETGENLGYAEGNNAGIRYILERQPEYVFVLNNDTLVEPNMLFKLVECALTSPSIGMVGPTVYYAEPSEKLFAAGSFILWHNGNVEHRIMFEDSTEYVGTGQPESVDFLVGCGVLVSRPLIETIGLLDSQYYLNYEDVEWCIRAQQNGFQVMYAPHAVMWHKVSATLGQASPANTYYMTRNALRFFWQNTPSPSRWLVIMRIIFRTLRTIGAWSVKPEYHEQLFQRKRIANLYALRDFFLGRFGAMGASVVRVCYGE
jgi:GT2 family glycosyltransferase